jgi:hypothetical protein
MKLDQRKIKLNVQDRAGDSPERIVLKYDIGEGKDKREIVGEAHRRTLEKGTGGQPTLLEAFDEMRSRAEKRLLTKVEAAIG